MHGNNPIYCPWHLHPDFTLEVTATNCIIISYMNFLAINECAAADTNGCSPNADCADTSSSYTCTCKLGYIGDGFSCTK